MDLEIRVDRQLRSCAAMGLVGAVSLACGPMVQSAQSAIYYTTTSYTITYATTPDMTVVFDMTATPVAKLTAGTGFVAVGAYPTYEFFMTFFDGAAAPSYLALYPQTADAYSTYLIGGTGTFIYPVITTAGTVIGSASAWSAGTVEASTLGLVYDGPASFAGEYWTKGSSGYVALKLTKGGLSYYGWIYASISAAGDITVGGFAWEGTAGVSIIAGAVPEPSSWALAALALGALGVSSWRRKHSDQLA